MERKLTKLFDYQKFAGNPRMQAVIDSVHRRPRELIPDDGELVSAAGVPYHEPTHDDDRKSHL